MNPSKMHPSPLHYSTMRPQAPAQLVPDPNEDELRNTPWYWGRITREEAKNILYGKPDGSFLVRDALSKKGEYTLTIMKDGTEKLIKICHINGKYGFVEKTLFNSVVEIVNYYKANSLSLYNKTLDVSLSNPIVRAYDEDDSQPHGDLRLLSDEFIRVHQLLQQKEQNLDQKKTLFNATREELLEKKLHQTVFGHAEKMFRSQITSIESFIKSPPPQNSTASSTSGSTTSISTGSDKGGNSACNGTARQLEQEHLRANLAELLTYLDDMHAKMECLNHYIESKKEEEQLLERQINAAKPELQTLQQRKDKHVERLKVFGLSEDDLNVILEKGYDEWMQHYENVCNQPHHNEASWLLKDYKRGDAEDVLLGAPTGTFLIRIRDAGHYALSIVCNESIHHCIIYETENGFGFAAPYNIYPTLKKLVEHYAFNSLEEHNDTLTTTLRYPVLFWHQNSQHILSQLREEEQEQLEQLDQETEAGGGSMPQPIPSTRARDAAGHDVVDAALASSETETPPASISPSNFSSSQ